MRIKFRVRMVSIRVFLKLVNEFHSLRCFSKAVMASFLTLIPKVYSPGVLKVYKPICLIGNLYRIFAKLLSIRLRLVIGKLISSCQLAFVPNMNTMDGLLIFNEIMDFAKKKIRVCMLVKVDFEKACNCVSWNFLRDLMGRMVFRNRWRGWMEVLIFNSFFSILVNRIPTEDFVVSGGLRQGGPLSAFLFWLVAEGLTTMMRKTSSVG